MVSSLATRRGRGVWLWAALVSVVVVVAHIPSFFHRLLDGDEAIYGSIAALMNGGGALYAGGGVDNKPPGIYWVYAATFHLAGTYQMTSIHAVGLLVMAATCVILFVIGRSIAGLRAGLLSALIYGILTGAGNPRLLASNTELFMMLPLTASVFLTLRRRWLWAGALLAAAGAFKQVAAINLLLVPVAVLLLEPSGRRLRASGLFAGGLSGGLLVGAALLASSGSLAGFWDWSVGSLYGYASTNWTPELVWQRAKDSVLPFVGSMAVVWVAALAFAWRWKRVPPAQRVIGAWLVVSLAGSLAGGHLSWHYFIQVMGPLALLAAFAVDQALSTPTNRWVAGATIAGLAVPMLGWGAFDLVADPLTYDFSPPVPQHEAVAAYIRGHTSPQDRVFVWGDWPALYVESDRIMATRFPGFLRGFARGSGLPPNNWDMTAEVWPELKADLIRNPPALIVDTAHGNWSDFSMYPMTDYPVLADFVTGGYHVVTTIDGAVIYARNA
jgi:4-amino-4-deoxy-L-arabinose transferase and related glycosyltransferases of PMT family